MKNTRFIAVMVALFIVIGTMAAAAATAQTKSPSPTMAQFKALQRRVTQAEVKIDNLQSRVAVLESSTPSPSACYGTIGVSQYNDYLSDDGVSSQTGLDSTTPRRTGNWSPRPVDSAREQAGLRAGLSRHPSHG